MLPHQQPVPRSKVYLNARATIAMNKDGSHRELTETKPDERKEVQEKKQIDKIMSNIVKERLFGSFMAQDTQLSLDSAYHVDAIYMHALLDKAGRSRPALKPPTLDHPSTLHGASPRAPQPPPTCARLHRTIDLSLHTPQQSLQQSRRGSVERPQPGRDTSPRVVLPRRRMNSQRLPSIQQLGQGKNELLSQRSQEFARCKLEINEKAFAETFRRWAGASSSQLTYDLRVTREGVVGKVKGSARIEGRLLERFFHFFMFPASFNLRQYCNLVEAAANCSLKFIHFFVFTLLDEHRNGILTSQDFFRFLQVHWAENPYVEGELFELQRLLALRNRPAPEEKEGDAVVEELLVLNHGIRLDELKILLKESAKERIDVDCPKNTCYHQTVLSLEHDPLERIKKGQIENTELANQEISQQAKQAQKGLENTPGLRLRDFFRFYRLRRPRLFTALLQLLANVAPQDYE